MGLFGYRYGWVPSPQGPSITEIECEKALELWGDVPDPPIFIFLPLPGSKAETNLKDLANKALMEDYPENPTDREGSQDRQTSFCDRLRNSGRFIRLYGTLQELRERAIVCIANWNKQHLKNAKQGRRQAPLSVIPPDELGGIDRDRQKKALSHALKALFRSKSPAMAVVVHGDEDMGHTHFLDWLANWRDREIDKPVVNRPWRLRRTARQGTRWRCGRSTTSASR